MNKRKFQPEKFRRRLEMGPKVNKSGSSENVYINIFCFSPQNITQGYSQQIPYELSDGSVHRLQKIFLIENNMKAFYMAVRDVVVSL